NVAEPADQHDPGALALARVRSISVPALGVLAALFTGTVALTWKSWGSVDVDCGASLYQAATIADGGVLYRDVLSPYGPVGLYALAGMFRLFGIHLSTAYATGLVVLLGESCLLWYIGRRFLSEPESVVALAGFWVLQAFQPGLLNWVLPNVFASPFGVLFATAVVALVVTDGERPRDWRLVAASLCTALAGLSKVEHGVAAFVTLAAYCVVVRPGRSGIDVARDLALATLPGLLLTLVVAGAFVAFVPWRQLLFDNVYRVRSFTGPIANYKSMIFGPLPYVYANAVVHYLVLLPLRVVAAALGLRLLGASAIRTGAGAVLVLVAVALPLLPAYPPNTDLVMSIWPGQFEWTPVVWATIVVFGALVSRRATAALPLVAIFSLAETLRWDLRVAWPPYYAVFASYLTIVVVRFVAGRFVSLRSPWPVVLVMCTWILASARSELEWYALATHWLRYPRGAIRTREPEGAAMGDVIDTLRRNTRPGDWVAVLPEEQMINFLAETRQPTRDTGIGPGWLATDADVRQYLMELDARAPRFVVSCFRRYLEFKAGVFQRYHPEIARYLAMHYTVRKVVGRFSILERKGAPGAAML
ncbi:MAG: hypothetical protein ACREQL_16020, partial [Candidatus Binatia bacterium]